MKTQIFTVAFAMLLILVNSCKPENLSELKNDPPIQTLTVDDEDVYDRSVMAGVYGLLRLSQNSTFRGIVNAKVAEQFDGDDNALLSTISTACNSNGIGLSDSFSTSIATYYTGQLLLNSYVNQAINGFSYFEETEYVQIYIPFIDLVNLNSNPIICLNLNGEDTLPGYKLVNGELVSYDVTKEMAQENLVWVVSVNERNASTNLISGPEVSENIEIESDTLYGDTTFNKKNTTPYATISIYGVHIGTKKESWPNGRSDIAFVGAQYDGNNHFEPLAKDIVKIGNDYINAWKWMYSTPSYFTSPSSLGPLAFNTDNECLSVMIYEKDIRRKFERSYMPVTYSPISGSNSSRLYYNSKETPYGVIYFPTSYFFYSEVNKAREVYLVGAKVSVAWRYVF